MCLMSNVMLSWPPVLIQAALTFVAALGAFQTAALHNDLDGLAWPVGLRHKRFGYLLAGLLLVIAFLGGVVLVVLNVELSSLLRVLAFLAGSGLALLVMIVGAALRLQWNGMRQLRPPRRGRPVELGPLRAAFYQPVGPGQYPALCLLPDPTAPRDDLTPLAQALVRAGIAVLALDWRLLDHPDRLTLQGLVSLGISYLVEQTEVGSERVGLVGVGLGGDLALRGAAMAPDVAAVLAIGPVLSTRRPVPGLESLCHLSWFGARRRAGHWLHSPLVSELDALSAVPRVAPRPVAIIAGYPDGPGLVGALEILRVTGGCPLTPAAHVEVVERTVQWFQEHLA